jgi:hypothetical protein
VSHLYQQYRALELDGSWIGLEVRNADPWFCTPIGAEIIGWDGAIHYCFVPGFAETVFCVNPENYGGHLVYPIARSFADFLSLLLAVGHTNSLQQVIGWKREEFERFLRQQEGFLNFSEMWRKFGMFSKSSGSSISSSIIRETI